MNVYLLELSVEDHYIFYCKGLFHVGKLMGRGGPPGPLEHLQTQPHSRCPLKLGELAESLPWFQNRKALCWSLCAWRGLLLRAASLSSLGS